MAKTYQVLISNVGETKEHTGVTSVYKHEDGTLEIVQGRELILYSSVAWESISIVEEDTTKEAGPEQHFFDSGLDSPIGVLEAIDILASLSAETAGGVVIRAKGQVVARPISRITYDSVHDRIEIVA